MAARIAAKCRHPTYEARKSVATIRSDGIFAKLNDVEPMTQMEQLEMERFGRIWAVTPGRSAARK